MKYKILQADSPINEKQLEELAQQGWELITIIQWSGNFYFYIRERDEADALFEKMVMSSVRRAGELLGQGDYDNIDHAAERVIKERDRLRKSLEAILADLQQRETDYREVSQSGSAVGRHHSFLLAEVYGTFANTIKEILNAPTV